VIDQRENAVDFVLQLGCQVAIQHDASAADRATHSINLLD